MEQKGKKKSSCESRVFLSLHIDVKLIVNLLLSKKKKLQLVIHLTKWQNTLQSMAPHYNVAFITLVSLFMNCFLCFVLLVIMNV